MSCELDEINKLDDLIRREIITTLIRNKLFSAVHDGWHTSALHDEIINNLINKKIISVQGEITTHQVCYLLNRAIDATPIYDMTVCYEDFRNYIKKLKRNANNSAKNDALENLEKQLRDSVFMFVKTLLETIKSENPNLTIEDAIEEINSWTPLMITHHWSGNTLIEEIATAVVTEINDIFEKRKCE